MIIYGEIPYSLERLKWWLVCIRDVLVKRVIKYWRVTICLKNVAFNHYKVVETIEKLMHTDKKKLNLQSRWQYDYRELILLMTVTSISQRRLMAFFTVNRWFKVISCANCRFYSPLQLKMDDSQDFLLCWLISSAGNADHFTLTLINIQHSSVNRKGFILTARGVSYWLLLLALHNCVHCQ